MKRFLVVPCGVEPSRAGGAAVAAVAGERGAHTLQPLVHTAVTASSEGGLQ